jgi:hypothetical protein
MSDTLSRPEVESSPNSVQVAPASLWRRVTAAASTLPIANGLAEKEALPCPATQT